MVIPDYTSTHEAAQHEAAQHVAAQHEAAHTQGLVLDTTHPATLLDYNTCLARFPSMVMQL